MVNLARWILGYVKFVFIGGFNDGFVNMCYEEKINVHSLKENGGELCGECLAREYIRLHSIARKNGGRIKIIKKYGFIFPLLKLKNRWGLFCGAIIFICLISFLSGFIWNIEIVGNERISDAQILSFLEQNGLQRGASWKKADKDKIENLLLASFDDCAWAHINEMGTTAKIEINETVIKPEVTPKAITNVKARKDGLIVKTSVTSGWQVARAGDSVTKGDLLISGIYDSEKKKGNQFAHASGEYIARVKEDFSLTVARNQSYKSYRKERIFKKISFFGLEIPLYIIPYEKKNTELEKSCDYLKLNSNEIPVGIITISERRYTINTKTLSDAELQRLASREAEKKISEDYSDYEIIKKDIDIALNSEDASVTGKIICLEDIGEEIPIKIKNK